MSTVESLGKTQTIRIGEPSNREVDNYSREIAITHEGTIIPLLGSSDETERRLDLANQKRLLDKLHAKISSQIIIEHVRRL